jgi:hypothetical protein
VVQVAENRTDLEGVVPSRGPDHERAGYDVLDLDVRRRRRFRATLTSCRPGSANTSRSA